MKLERFFCGLFSILSVWKFKIPIIYFFFFSDPKEKEDIRTALKLIMKAAPCLKFEEFPENKSPHSSYVNVLRQGG